jgi:hypothetical protein
MLHLCHNDRVKKRCATSFDFVSFSTTDQRILRKGSFSAKEASPEPPTDQRFEGWPHERVQQPPRALGLRAHYWSEVRRLAPRKGSTATSGHSGSAPTTDQGFVGWPLKGSTAASEHAERGMTLGTFDT